MATPIFEFSFPSKEKALGFVKALPDLGTYININKLAVQFKGENPEQMVAYGFVKLAAKQDMSAGEITYFEDYLTILASEYDGALSITSDPLIAETSEPWEQDPEAWKKEPQEEPSKTTSRNAPPAVEFFNYTIPDNQEGQLKLKKLEDAVRYFRGEPHFKKDGDLKILKGDKSGPDSSMGVQVFFVLTSNEAFNKGLLEAFEGLKGYVDKNLSGEKSQGDSPER